MPRMKNITVTLMCLGCSPALASDVDVAVIAGAPNLMSELDVAKINEAIAAADLKAASENSASAKTEQQSLSDQVKQLTQEYAAHNARTKALRDAKLAPYKAAVDRHNASCPLGSSADAGLVALCHGEVVQLTAWRQRLDPEINALKMEGARLDTRRDPMLKRMEELDASVQPLAKREAAALAKRQAAADRVEGLKNQVATAYSVCRTLVAKVDPNKQSDAQETIRLCNSVQWDKADPGLKPLTDIRPPLSETPGQ